MKTREPAFQRARRPEHKEQRYRSILEAARTLALRDGVRAVSLTDIGAEAGIAKSAVRRYFETREEIYLHLTAEGWQSWAEAVRAGGTPAPDGLASALTRPLAASPLFCDLLAHAALNLERHVSTEVVRAFKLTALAALDDLVAVITEAAPRIDRQGAVDLVATVSALAASLWQTAHPPPALARLYEEDPRLAHAAADFPSRLERLTAVLITGLCGGRPD